MADEDAARAETRTPVAVRTRWQRWWPYARPVLLLALSIAVGWGVVQLVGAVDWPGVAEPEIVAGLVVWRTVTIFGPLLLGLGTFAWWRASQRRDLPAVRMTKIILRASSWFSQDLPEWLSGS